MSEILLDRVRLTADGNVSLVVRVRRPGSVRPPDDVTVRLVARGAEDEVVVPATVADAEGDEWSATCAVSHKDLRGVSDAVTIVDCFVDVTVDGEVVSGRVTWDVSGTRWLPYPTAGRMLSLTRVDG